MTCSACSARVEKAVKKLEGANVVQVNLLTASMNVEYDPDRLDEEGIISAVTKAGYGASVKGDSGKKAAKRKEGPDPAEEARKAMKSRTIWSFVFLIPLMYVSMGHMAGLPLPFFLEGEKNSVSFWNNNRLVQECLLHQALILMDIQLNDIQVIFQGMMLFK